MQETSSDNKRIAKNTLFLYGRMLFLLVVSLYTSRVTLQVLGVDDFGVYNIVGGVVVLFAFLSRFLTSACNRFFSVAVGKGDVADVQKNFSTALVAHVLLIIIVLILLETIGLWFVIHKIKLPLERQQAALWVYQFATLSVCLNIIRIPFNGSVVAHEKMDFYAYTSVVEGIIKLIIVWLLLLIPYDKLITYSILMILSVLIINAWYIWYCEKSFEGNKILFKIDKLVFKEMLSFSGWNTFVGVADIGWQQGTNVILNMFHGVTLNTAMGITNSIRTVVYSFVSNLQTAANPQIIKQYNNGEFSKFESLVYAISKYSFILMLFFSIPLIINMEFVLKIWLGVVPDHAVQFAILILIFGITDTLSGPLWVSVQANGKIKVFSIVYSLILLLNLPVTYLLFMNQMAPESMLVGRIVINVVAVLWELLFVRYLIKINVEQYVFHVLMPIIVVSIISIFITYGASCHFTCWTKLFVSIISSSLTIIISSYVFALTKKEKDMLRQVIKNKLLGRHIIKR